MWVKIKVGLQLWKGSRWMLANEFAWANILDLIKILIHHLDSTREKIINFNQKKKAKIFEIESRNSIYWKLKENKKIEFKLNRFRLSSQCNPIQDWIGCKFVSSQIWSPDKRKTVGDFPPEKKQTNKQTM